MKNYLKFIVAICGVTIAIFSTVTKANARVRSDVKCISYGTCGTTHSGATIEGQV